MFVKLLNAKSVELFLGLKLTNNLVSIVVFEFIILNTSSQQQTTGSQFHIVTFI